MDRIIHLLAHKWRCTSRTLLSQSTRTPSSTTCRLLPVCQSDKPNNQSAHSRLRRVLGFVFAERASPTGCEPKDQEQLEDFMAQNFALVYGVSLTSSNASSSGSMAEVAATTITGTESYGDFAERSVVAPPSVVRGGPVGPVGPGWSGFWVVRSGGLGTWGATVMAERAFPTEKAEGGAEDSCSLKDPEIGQPYMWEEALVWLKRAEQD